MDINDTYFQLRQLKICKSGCDFSVNFLGRKANYFSVILARKQQPTTAALLNCSIALQGKIAGLQEEKHPVIQRARNSLIKIHSEVKTELHTRCLRELSVN